MLLVFLSFSGSHDFFSSHWQPCFSSLRSMNRLLAKVLIVIFSFCKISIFLLLILTF